MLKALQLYRNYAKHIKTGVDWLEPFEHYTPGQVISILVLQPTSPAIAATYQHANACEARPLFSACKSIGAARQSVGSNLCWRDRWLSVVRSRV
jgi:hypothetical protein